VPSRNRWYVFRDRVGPLLETWNRQVLEWAVAQGLTTASRGSLDGTLIAANASRHRLLNLARLERRLQELDRVIAADKAAKPPGDPRMDGPPPATDGGNATAFTSPQEVAEGSRPAMLDAPAATAKPRQDVVSPSDFEAALGRDKEKVFRPLYNGPVRSGRRNRHLCLVTMCSLKPPTPVR